MAAASLFDFLRVKRSLPTPAVVKLAASMPRDPLAKVADPEPAVAAPPAPAPRSTTPAAPQPADAAWWAERNSRVAKRVEHLRLADRVKLYGSPSLADLVVK